MFTVTASIGRPKVSASTIAITVRVPVPRSCDPIAASTVPSGCTFTWQFDAWPRPPQVWIESPSPRRTVPVAAAARLPVLLPAHQIGGDLELLLVDGLALAGRDRQVLAEEVERIHPQLGGEVLHDRHGEERRLRMVGRAPGARAGEVGRHRGVDVTAIGRLEHVGQRCGAGAGQPARSPRVGDPRHHVAVAVGARLDGRPRRGPAAGDRLLVVALDEELDRALRFAREPRRLDVPAIDLELRAEAAAHVVGLHVHVGGGDLERLGELSGEGRDRLRRGVRGELVAAPLGDLPCGSSGQWLIIGTASVRSTLTAADA